MPDTYSVKSYYIRGCKVDNKAIFNGYVFNIDDEPITESIKRKLNVNSLLCEITNEGFEYDPVDMYSIPFTELTIGDFMLLLGKKLKS